ncbi:MAG TPA: glycosyltransferase 87 family protein [Azospirillum sp.]|nr:glycosyltransferase 87 family protein [Azospirillum sp.]
MDGTGVHREAAGSGMRSLADRLRADWPLVLWALSNVAIAVLALVWPLWPSTRGYVASTLDWWTGEPVYTVGPHGFLHFPAAAVLFGPFALLPPMVADQTWRLLSVLVFTLAAYRAARLIRPDAGERVAPYVLLLAFPAASIDILRGQWELMTFAVLLHATVDIALGHNARGGLLLALAVALKPTALVPALLFGALRWNLLPWLLPGLAAVFLGPFLHGDPAYVARQYAAMAEALRVAAGSDGPWLDATALLRRLGLTPAYASMTAVRVIAAIATLWAGVQAYRRLDRPTAALVVLMLAVTGLLLFGPHTGEEAYVGLATLAGLAAFAEVARRPLAALPVLLGALALALGTHLYGDWLHRPMHGWLKPTLALAFYGYAAMLIATGRSIVDPPPEPMHVHTWLPNRVALVVCLALPPAFGIYRLVTAASLPNRLTGFTTTDFLILVVVLNVVAFALVTASGPILAWMRGRRS